MCLGHNTQSLKCMYFALLLKLGRGGGVCVCVLHLYPLNPRLGSKVHVLITIFIFREKDNPLLHTDVDLNETVPYGESGTCRFHYSIYTCTKNENIHG